MGKHAYLIAAYNQFDLLRRLLSCLDYPENDIFLHIDKKAEFDREKLEAAVKQSKLYFTDRISVEWGGNRRLRPHSFCLNKASA